MIRTYALYRLDKKILTFRLSCYMTAMALSAYFLIISLRVLEGGWLSNSVQWLPELILFGITINKSDFSYFQSSSSPFQGENSVASLSGYRPFLHFGYHLWYSSACCVRSQFIRLLQILIPSSRFLNRDLGSHSCWFGTLCSTSWRKFHAYPKSIELPLIYLWYLLAIRIAVVYLISMLFWTSARVWLSVYHSLDSSSTDLLVTVDFLSYLGFSCRGADRICPGAIMHPFKQGHTQYEGHDVQKDRRDKHQSGGRLK